MGAELEDATLDELATDEDDGARDDDSDEEITTLLELITEELIIEELDIIDTLDDEGALEELTATELETTLLELDVGVGSLTHAVMMAAVNVRLSGFNTLISFIN